MSLRSVRIVRKKYLKIGEVCGDEPRSPLGIHTGFLNDACGFNRVEGDMKIIDLSAGNRAVWYNKEHLECLYVDIRESVKPDLVADSTALPDSVGSGYDLIVFDPPHNNSGPNSNMSRVYGYHTTARIYEIIEGTGKEAWRIGNKEALMAFKWNDCQIKLQKVLDLMPQWEPLFGHLTKDGPGSKTYWVMLKRRPI